MVLSLNARMARSRIGYAPLGTHERVCAGMKDDTLQPTSGQLETIQRGIEYIVRSQTFQSGETLAVCSCGESAVFPAGRATSSTCPRGLPWACLAQQSLPFAVRSKE